MTAPRAPAPGGRRGMRGLQARLLVWFLAAIVLAIGASALTTALTSGDSDAPTRIVSGHVQRRLARTWDDRAATERYVAELRETTGLDIKVTRDPSIFEGRRGRRGSGIVFEDGVAFVPITRGGVVVGAVEMHTGAARPEPWRIGAALGAALLALGVVARRVSQQLARPLEHLAQTADRFGSGDLDARTGIEHLPKRWVAEEVRDVGRAFDGMADRISRVVVEQRELLAAISHELRSPLGRARVAVEIARERPDPSAALDDVERQLVDIDAILGDLLASARAGLADVRRERTGLVAWLRSRIASEGEGPVELSAPSDGEVLVDIDAALLGRALHNVLANAWNHGHPKDTPLLVSCAIAGDRARVAVRDRGPGFPPALLARAFEPFVTGADSARSPGAHGIGLGLSLVRRIVEAHGGGARAENVVDGGQIIGAEVSLELPIASRV